MDGPGQRPFAPVERGAELPAITFLRVPVARPKSMFRHMGEGKFVGLDPKTLDLGAPLASEHPWLQNEQARALL
jgi:hypothetical protein